MAKTTVYDEVVSAFAIKQKKGESVQEFLRRLVSAMDTKLEQEAKLKGDKKDKVWKTLSKKAQDWFNLSIDSWKEDKLPLPDGLEADENEDEAEAEADEKPAKNGKGKAGKKEKAAKGGKGKSKSAKDDDEADEADEDEDEKPKKKAKKGKGGIAGKRAPTYKPDQKLTLLVKKNPKKEGTGAHERFENYFSKKVKTVGDALKAGVKMADLVWDSHPDRQYIKIA